MASSTISTESRSMNKTHFQQRKRTALIAIGAGLLILIGSAAGVLVVYEHDQKHPMQTIAEQSVAVNVIPFLAYAAAYVDISWR